MEWTPIFPLFFLLLYFTLYIHLTLLLFSPRVRLRNIKHFFSFHFIYFLFFNICYNKLGGGKAMQFRDWLSELFASLSDAIFNNEAGGEKVLSKKDILFGQ